MRDIAGAWAAVDDIFLYVGMDTADDILVLMACGVASLGSNLINFT